MITVGRLCVKIAGRDAGKTGVIISILDDKFVMIDGQTRRRKCNISHIELVDKTIEIEDNADHNTVADALGELGIEVKKEAKAKKETAKAEKPKKLKKKKSATEKKEEKPKKVAKAKK